MIFVTVGTHEQSFNRLIQAIDELAQSHSITDDVFVQIGFSTYEPKFCKWKRFLSYDEMEHFIEKADLVVSHGGPATFMSVLAKTKKCLVVPRLTRFDEHVNDHQLEFLEQLQERRFNIDYIKDISELRERLTDFEQTKQKPMYSNTSHFVKEFEGVIGGLYENKI